MKDGTSIQSPAMGLAHEMGHGAMYLDGWYDGSKTRDQRESTNLKTYETPIAKQLGQPTRAKYLDAKDAQRMSNSIHYVTTTDLGIGFYFDPRNWGKSNKKIVHHNRWPYVGATIGQ